MTIHHTTSYNPAANGMVERMHRTLKAALTARCSGPDWKAQLPFTLLGIRTSPKEGLQVSPAEMVYGETLAVPGEFFPTPTDDVDLHKLRRTADKYRPCVQTYRDALTRYIPESLQSCRSVFVREDAHRSPLTCPYRGPFIVLDRNPKAFLIDNAGSADWVSIDRLKPAYLPNNDPPPHS